MSSDLSYTFSSSIILPGLKTTLNYLAVCASERTFHPGITIYSKAFIFELKSKESWSTLVRLLTHLLAQANALFYGTH